MNFSKLIFSLSALFLIYSTPVLACSCVFIDNFCESIVEEDGEVWENFHIYYVKVTSSDDSGMNIDVLRTFSGDDHTGDELFVVNGYEIDCRRTTLDFAVGKTYIVSAWKYDDSWAIPYCGVGFLPVEDGRIQGPIAPGVTDIALDELPSVMDCGTLNGPTDVHDTDQGEPSWTVFPSISSQQVAVKAQNQKVNVPYQLEVFDVSGKLMHRVRNIQPYLQPSFTVDIHYWASGMYLFRITGDNRQQTFKVIKS